MEQPLQLFAGKGSAAAHTRYRIEDRSYLSLIKKEIGKAAETIGFSAERIGRLDIILNELVSNLIKHGLRKRELLWKIFFHGREAGIEILALDGGPGISNTGLAMQDGYSTSGTAGEGLGAIKRLSDTFDLYSQSGIGTTVLTRLFASKPPAFYDTSFTIAAISVAKPGEKLCGDGFYVKYEPEQQLLRLLVLDGLGHGPDAYLAAQAGIEEYAKARQQNQCEVLQQLHNAMQKTRGAVAMSLHYSFEDKMLNYCGAGNISGRLIGGPEGTKALMSYNGIVGHTMSPRLNEQHVAWEKGKLLILHSDGITSRWDLSKYQQIHKQDPALIAACLYRDFNRGTDDVTVVVCKHPDTHGRKVAKSDH